MDGTRRFFTAAVDVAALPVAVEKPGGSALPDVARVLAAAQLIGAGRAVLDQAIAYACERKQFGRVIGSFQGLKHQLANVRIALDFAWPLTLRAAHQLDSRPGVLLRDAAAAKASAAEAARLAARTALQVHGAIGYTEELDLQLWLKRIWSLLPQWGTPGQLIGRWSWPRCSGSADQRGSPDELRRGTGRSCRWSPPHSESQLWARNENCRHGVVMGDR